MNKLIFTLLLLPILLLAQSDDRTYGVIFQFQGKNLGPLSQELTHLFPTAKLSLLGNFTQSYLVESDNDALVFGLLKKRSDVKTVGYNFEVKTRIRPNDSRLSELYHLNLIRAFEVWDSTTGGTNHKGEDIVIGILDDGFEMNHEDLKNNLYTNPDEIPDDGKDNDGNGLIDDYQGWNVRTGNKIHDLHSHGTNILGVIGAEGNNNIGITGINWRIKMMPVTIGNFVSEVIKGYEYLIGERRLYNTSGGTKGANIVVTSYSGGLDRKFAKDFPAWCELYDIMGNEGMLNICSTTNDDSNVEEVGDMPSTCASDYLLVVSSTNRVDEKDEVTGYGNVSVDISAPGEQILTTDLISRGLYKKVSGTSLSTPIVSGAAALLYSYKCASFHDFVKSNGPGAALSIKNILMTTVDKKETLRSRSVSEGRVNILSAMNKLISLYCNDQLKLLNVTYINDGLDLVYTGKDGAEIRAIIFDASGRQVLSTTFTSDSNTQKKQTIRLDNPLQGMIYFVSLMEGENIQSKGFNANLPR